MGKEKVEVAIFDNDLKIRTRKKYEISDNGTQIRIVSGGEGHFMPIFDNQSYLEFPSWKRFLFFGPRAWKRLYFVKKKGEKCVNFDTGETKGPNPEQLKQSNARLLAMKIGQDVNKGTPWYVWFLLVLVLLSFFLQLRIAGVIP